MCMHIFFIMYFFNIYIYYLENIAKIYIYIERERERENSFFIMAILWTSITISSIMMPC